MATRAVRPISLALAALVASFVLASRPVSTQGNGANSPNPAPQTNGGHVPGALHERAAQGGRVRVLVEVAVADAHVPEGRLNLPARLAQRQRLNVQQARLLSRLPTGRHRVLRRFQTIPWVALEADAATLAALDTAGGDIVRIVEDAMVRPVLSESVPLIQGDQAWAVGMDGAGTTIAVLDTGVDAAHPFLANKVVEEACYSGGDAGHTTSFCPNGQPEQIGPGSATPCWLDGCYHGTHVAGIAAGNGTGAGVSFSGVAKNANIMAVQVFTQVDDLVACGFLAPCLGGFTSDIIAGLERVYAVAAQHHIASVNLSLGEGEFFAACDNQPYKPIIDNLRSIGVATIAAAGNDGFTEAMLTPACISSVVSVGATARDDTVAYFSDVAPFLSLFAPGDEIVSAIPDGFFFPLSGTSMAAPHAAGAFAILRQAVPAASVTTLLNALRLTGKPITDTRAGTGTTAPRINIYQALASLNAITHPVPVLTQISPTGARAGNPALTLTLTGSGFNAFSVIRWNGIDRPTNVISVTSLTTTLSAADLATVASVDVAVFTPGPGGGLSSVATFTIDPPPTLTLSAATVIAGGSETVTLHDGLGGANDWIGLFAIDSSDSSYIQWTYVGTGVTTRTWTVTMPSTAGQYEFRLIKNFARKATSPLVTVDPAPPAELTVDATTVTAGGSSTVTIANAPGGTNDWIALAATGSSDTSYLQWTYVGAGVTARTWTVTMPSTPGTYQFRLFGNANARLATSPDVTVIPGAPTVTSLSPASVVVGSAPITLTVTGTGFLATSTVRWNGADRPTTFVSATQLRAAIPASDLTTVGAPQVTVFLPAPGGGLSSPLSFTITPTPSLSVGTTSAAGGTQVTVTLANGYGGSWDWLALAAVGSADSTYVDWTYVGSGVMTRTWSATVPLTGGTFEFRLFLNSTYTRAATSPPVTALPGPPTVTSLSPTSASVGGAPVTLTVSGSNFVAASTIRWNGADRPTTFVSATQLRATIPASDLTAVGTAQVTAFSPPPGGGLSASSLPFAITPPPSLSVNTTSVAGGAPISVTLANGLGGSWDWLALAAVGSPDTSYVDWTYVGSGVTARSWTATAPLSGGAYEFRLFLNSTYTRRATSPAVTVIPGPPSVTSLSPASGSAGGTSFTLTVSGTNFRSTSTVRWNGADRPTTFASATQVRAAIPASDLAAVGTAQVSVYSPPPGGGVSGSLPFTIAPPPSLSVGTTSAVGGTPVTVTLANGLGGAYDWLAFAAAGSPDSSYVEWIYVGSGVTSRTWTVTTPVNGGTFEFRLFLNSSYTRGATSPAVTVAPGPGATTLTVSAGSVIAGTSITATLTNGPGGANDWLALAPVGSSTTTYTSWTYVGAGVTNRTWVATAPTTPGQYEFRLFLNNGYVRGATSPPFTVIGP